MYHAVSVLLSDSKFGASGSPIGPDLFRTGDNRPLCQDPVNAVLLSLLEIPLDQAILEAMEADDRHPRSDVQPAAFRSSPRGVVDGVEQRPEGSQLVVEGLPADPILMAQDIPQDFSVDPGTEAGTAIMHLQFGPDSVRHLKVSMIEELGFLKITGISLAE